MNTTESPAESQELGYLHEEVEAEVVVAEPSTEIQTVKYEPDVAIPSEPRPMDTLMTREQYRALADRLILDRPAWIEYFSRCKCVVSAGMYGHKDAATVAVAGLKGMSLGMSFMEAIDRIKVIHGTPVIRGSAAINHIHERCKGAKCRCILSTPTEAVWRMERPGWDAKEFRFTWDDAEKAGLLKNNVYKLYPARCLKWQAASEGAQEMFGDVLGGLYFQEEIHAEPEKPQEVVYQEPPSGSSSTGPGDGSSSTGTTVEPTDDHPKSAMVSKLLTAVALKQNVPQEQLESVRKKIYYETLHALRMQRDNQPTLPQLDRIIAHLEGLCSA